MHAEPAAPCPEAPLPVPTGTHNFRSLAGLPAADGRRVAAHRLMRSDRLARLTPEDWAWLDARTGLRTVCDLRGHDEAEQAPTPLPAGGPVRRLALDIRNDVRSDPSLIGLLRDDPTPAAARQMMRTIYARFPEVFASRLPRLFEALCEPGHDGSALLVHCAAGKDRTGFVIAMLLHALGTPRDAVMADYLTRPPSLGEDDPRLEPMRQQLRARTGIDLPPAALVPVLEVEADHLRESWRVIDAAHGGPDAYLAAAGLTPERRERLRARLLTPG